MLLTRGRCLLGRLRGLAQLRYTTSGSLAPALLPQSQPSRLNGPTIRYLTGAQHIEDRTLGDEDDTSFNFEQVEKLVEDNTGTTLRPYQETAVSACLSALSSGLTRLGVSSPTGSGKTTMFISLIPRIETTTEGSRVLILVGSVELANQAENAARRLLGDGYRIEVEQGKRIASGTADM